LQKLGFEVTYLDINEEGRVSAESVQEHLKKETILVSIMAANNEIGVINPIGEIGRVCQAAGVALMVDAIQAFGKVALAPKELGISLLSMSGQMLIIMMFNFPERCARRHKSWPS